MGSEFTHSVPQTLWEPQPPAAYSRRSQQVKRCHFTIVPIEPRPGRYTGYNFRRARTKQCWAELFKNLKDYFPLSVLLLAKCFSCKHESDPTLGQKDLRGVGAHAAIPACRCSNQPPRMLRSGLFSERETEMKLPGWKEPLGGHLLQVI